MYKCKYFKIQELVDKETFTNNPEWKLWLSFDPRLITLIDILRVELNSPITINNWHTGGNRSNSGLRTPTSPYYSQFSQHSFGRAVDMIVKKWNPRDVRNKLKELVESKKLEGITNTITVEETKYFRDHGLNTLSWVHLDVRNNNVGYNEFYV